MDRGRERGMELGREGGMERGRDGERGRQENMEEDKELCITIYAMLTGRQLRLLGEAC